MGASGIELLSNGNFIMRLNRSIQANVNDDSSFCESIYCCNFIHRTNVKRPRISSALFVGLYLVNLSLNFNYKIALCSLLLYCIACHDRLNSFIPTAYTSLFYKRPLVYSPSKILNTSPLGTALTKSTLSSILDVEFADRRTQQTW